MRSLKQKRSVVRPIVAEVQRRFAASVAETGYHDLYRRAEIGVAVVSGDGRRCRDVLDAVERMLVERPEVDVLEVRRRLYSSTDDLADDPFDDPFDDPADDTVADPRSG